MQPHPTHPHALTRPCLSGPPFDLCRRISDVYHPGRVAAGGRHPVHHRTLQGRPPSCLVLHCLRRPRSVAFALRWRWQCGAQMAAQCAALPCRHAQSHFGPQGEPSPASMVCQMLPASIAVVSLPPLVLPCPLQMTELFFRSMHLPHSHEAIGEGPPAAGCPHGSGSARRSLCSIQPGRCTSCLRLRSVLAPPPADCLASAVAFSVLC